MPTKFYSQTCYPPKQRRQHSRSSTEQLWRATKLSNQAWHKALHASAMRQQKQRNIFCPYVPTQLLGQNKGPSWPSPNTSPNTRSLGLRIWKIRQFFFQVVLPVHRVSSYGSSHSGIVRVLLKTKYLSKLRSCWNEISFNWNKTLPKCDFASTIFFQNEIQLKQGFDKTRFTETRFIQKDILTKSDFAKKKKRWVLQTSLRRFTDLTTLTDIDFCWIQDYGLIKIENTVEYWVHNTRSVPTSVFAGQYLSWIGSSFCKTRIT